jgi:hypothetical protein
VGLIAEDLSILGNQQLFDLNLTNSLITGGNININDNEGLEKIAMNTV